MTGNDYKSLEVPDGYQPFFLRELRTDSYATGLSGPWEDIDSKELNIALSAISGRSERPLKELLHDSVLRFKSSDVKQASRLGNFIFSSGLLIVSNTAMEIIKRFDTSNMELYPVEIELYKKIKGRDFLKDVGGGEVIHGYWMINFISHEDVVDFAQSEAEYAVGAPGERWVIRHDKLVLSGKPKHQGLYRIKGLLGYGYLSKELEDAFTGERVKSVNSRYSLSARYKSSEDEAICIEAL
jgi:hypothetical protein